MSVGVRWDERASAARAAKAALLDPYVRAAQEQAHAGNAIEGIAEHGGFSAGASAPAQGVALATASALTWVLGPVGAVASIVFSLIARRELTGPRGRFAAGFGLAFGAMATLAWVGLGGLLLARHAGALLADAEPTAEAAEAPATNDDAEPSAPAPPSAAPPSAPPSARAGQSARHAPPGGSADPRAVLTIAPPATKLGHVGAITVVDVGARTPELRTELARQRADAAKKGETVMVMTTGGRCEPCRGVDRALADPLMQKALAKVRLIRVDVDVFRDDLKALIVPTDRFPVFVLLSPDLTPRDAVDGGEWGDDVAENIAPVLGPFLEGTLVKRKTPWTPHASSGIRL